MISRFARILRKGESPIEGVDVLIDTVTGPSGLTSWQGQFWAPLSEKFTAGSPLDLTLDDGRSGRALVAEVEISSGSDVQLVRFTGSGSLT